MEKRMKNGTNGAETAREASERTARSLVDGFLASCPPGVAETGAEGTYLYATPVGGTPCGVERVEAGGGRVVMTCRPLAGGEAFEADIASLGMPERLSALNGLQRAQVRPAVFSYETRRAVGSPARERAVPGGALWALNRATWALGAL